jgi:hypothetical protein
MALRLKDDFKPGFINQLTADWLNTVARWLNSLNIANGEVERTPFDMTIYPGLYGDFSNNLKRPFDIVDITDDNFKISDFLSDQSIWYRGKRIASITAGAGLTFDTDHWEATDPLAADQYVWLEIDNSNAGETTIIMGSDMQADTEDPRFDYIEVIPLWFFPVATGAITAAGIGDLRGSFRLSAMA